MMRIFHWSLLLSHLFLSSLPLLVLSDHVLSGRGLSSHVPSGTVSLPTPRPDETVEAPDSTITDTIEIDQQICDTVPAEYHIFLGCNNPTAAQPALVNAKRGGGKNKDFFVLKKKIGIYTITIKPSHNSYAGPKVGETDHFNLVVHKDLPQTDTAKPKEQQRKKPKKAHVHNFHISLYSAPGKTCTYIWDSVPRDHPKMRFNGDQIGKVILDTCVGPGDIAGAVSAITSKMSESLRDLVTQVDWAELGLGLAAVLATAAAIAWQLTIGAVA